MAREIEYYESISGEKMGWLARLFYKNPTVGDAAGHGANFAAGFSDGVLMGHGETLAKAVYGDNMVLADKDSGWYTGGMVTGIGATMIGTGGSVATTRGIASGAQAVRASSWALKPTQAVLNSGKWAVKGGSNWYGYAKTGLWGGKVTNGVVSWAPRSAYSSVTEMVRLQMPSTRFFGVDGNWKAYVWGQFKVR